MVRRQTKKELQGVKVMGVAALVAVLGISTYMVNSFSGKNFLRRVFAAENLEVYASPGIVQLNPSKTAGEVVLAGNNWGGTITVRQDEGYFFKFVRNGQPVIAQIVEVSMKRSDGTWTSWSEYKNGSKNLVPDVNGLMKIDFSEWGPLNLGVYTAKFRIKGTTAESLPISVEVKPADTTGYFPFEPGNYYVFTQTNNPSGYWARFDVEETYNFSIDTSDRALGTSYKGVQSGVFNPLRITMSSNSTWVPGYDFTWFLSKSFDSFSNQDLKWAIASYFYQRDGKLKISKTPTTTGYGPGLFVRKGDNWPAYYVAAKLQNLAVPVYNPNKPFDTLHLKHPYFGGPISSAMVNKAYQDVGWRTAYRVLKVNFPAYSGPALRIRFWEFDGGEWNTSPSVNNDDWYFVKGLGLVGIDSQSFRNSICAQNAACSDTAPTMQAEGENWFSIRLTGKAIFQDGEMVKAQIGYNNVFADLTSIKAGQAYQVRITRNDGSPYTGFLEVQGTYTSPTGVITNIPRVVISDINKNPVLTDNNGVGSVLTGLNQGKGKYAFQARPYIFTENAQRGVILSANNRLGWSNWVTVELR